MDKKDLMILNELKAKLVELEILQEKAVKSVAEHKAGIKWEENRIKQLQSRKQAVLKMIKEL